MLNTTNSNSEYLHNYIRKVAKQEQESVDISNVYSGTIEAAQSGIYTVTLNQSDNSSSVLAIPIVTGDIYDKNDYVYLLKANTTATVNYFIVGKVDAVQETFFNLTDLERFNPDSAKTKDYVFGTESSIAVEDENNIFNNISNLGYFQFEVKFNSKIDNNTDGFEIYLNYVSDNEYDALFTFKAYEFIGQPNEENYSLVQKKIFHLSTDIVITNIKIKKIGSFIVSGINLVAGSLLKVSAVYQNNIIVQNDRNYFEKEMYDASNPLNTITLTSKIYYNNKPLVGDVLQYYWFLKDDSATNSASDDYLNIEGAGNGWRCLNNFQWVNTAETKQKVDANGNLVFDESGNAVYEFVQTRIWNNKNNFIVLNKTNESVNFSNFVNKIKCIAKYFDNFIESDLIDIYNYENENFTINLNASSNIIVDAADKVTLTCEVLNDGEKIDLNQYSLEYQWYKKTAVAAEGENITPKIVEEGKEDKEITKYSSFYVYDSKYPSTDIPENGYQLDEEEQELSFYCKVAIIPLKGKSRYEESSNEVTIETVASDSELTQNIEYKYYIATHSKVKFQESSETAEGKGTYNTGDWKIIDEEVTSENWSWLPNESIYDEEGNYEVFYDLNIFEGKAIEEEHFVYYTQRKIWKQNGQNIKAEDWSFPQIARSVINVNGWKNHRVGDNINQLNTFNQLTKNGEEDGIYYAEIPELIKDSSTPVWGTAYYKRIITNSNITYQPISLKETIAFKGDENYYIYNTDNDSYGLIDKSNVEYNSELEYYKKISDTEYKKLVVNTQNFDITVAWPDNEEGPFYENIDNKLFINATYIRSGTLEVEDKFYASIDQDEVNIGGFLVDETTLISENGAIGLNSNKNNLNAVAIWAGGSEATNSPFQVNHQGQLIATDGIFTGEIRSGNLTYETEQEPDTITKVKNQNDTVESETQSFYNLTGLAVELSCYLALPNNYVEGSFTIDKWNNPTINCEAQIKDDPSGTRSELDNSLITYDLNSNVYQISNNKLTCSIYLNIDNSALEIYDFPFDVEISRKFTYSYKTVTSGDLIITDKVISGGVISFKDIPYLKFKDFQIDQTGAITATSGTIGGFHITNDHLGSGDYESNNDTANDLVMLSPGLANGGYVFWAGNKSENGDDSTRPFWIKNDGRFKANNGTIADWTVEPYRLIGPSIRETNDAKAYPRVGMSAASGHGSWAFWAGGHPDEDGIEGSVAYGSKSKFHVSHSGELYAESAEITGKINAEQGYIGNNLLITGDGFSTNNYSLTESGLFFETTTSSLKVGKTTLQENIDSTNGSYTSFETTNSLIISSAVTGSSIKFMPPSNWSGSVETSYTFYITRYDLIDGPKTRLYYEIDKASTMSPYYPFNASFSIYKKTTKDSQEVLLASKIPCFINKDTITGYYDVNGRCGDTDLLKIEVNFPTQTATNGYQKFKVSGGGGTIHKPEGNYPIAGATIKQTTDKDSLFITGNLSPEKNNQYSLGTSGKSWVDIYAKNQSIVNSDYRMKNSFALLSEKYDLFFDKIQPKSYRFNENTSNRTHLGFSAQEVKEALLQSDLTSQDFAGYCEWKDESFDDGISCGLRYGEFIPLCIDQVQKLKTRVKELENKLKEIKGE